MNLKKIGKVFTSKFVGTGPSSYGGKKKEFTGPWSHKGGETLAYTFHYISDVIYHKPASCSFIFQIRSIKTAESNPGHRLWC